MRRCSCTVRFGKMPRPSGTRHSPARARSSGSAPFTRRPARTMLAAAGGVQPGDHRQQRRLAGAVRAEHGDHRAGRHVEVDAVEDLDRARSRRRSAADARASTLIGSRRPR